MKMEVLERFWPYMYVTLIETMDMTAAMRLGKM